MKKSEIAKLKASVAGKKTLPAFLEDAL